MTDCKNVIYSFVSYRRNIKDMPFVNKLSDTEQAIGVCRSLSEIFGDDYEFKMLKNLPLTECLKLEEKNVITKELIENKDISAFALNGQGCIVLINEEDHIRLISKKDGFCLEDCFTLANQMDDIVLDKLEMSFNNNLGYLTAKLEKVGTGLECGCLLFIPALFSSEKAQKTINEITDTTFEVLNINGTKYDNTSPFVLIKNRYTFGFKENQIAEKVQKVIEKLISLEVLEENNLFNISASTLVDKIYRSYGVVLNCYRLSENEAIEKLGLILWGINLNILKFVKKFDIFAFIAKIKENHLKNGSENIKDTQKKRAKICSNKVLECIVKGEVDV